MRDDRVHSFYRPAHAASNGAQCGVMVGGVQALCDEHLSHFDTRYPQGWSGYPGDTCRHGVYVGGSGRDLMCWRCEIGDELE